MADIFDNINTMVWGTDSEAVYGRKPVIPAFPSSQEIQSKATKSNLVNFSDIANLATKTNTFNQSQLTAMIDRSLPGARPLIESNIKNELEGKLPEGVLRNLRQSYAERGVASGAVGTGFNLGSELGSELGLSLQLTQQGISSAERWLQQAQAPSFDVTRMFVSPEMQYKVSSDEFQRSLMAEKVAAAPDPATRGSFDTFMSVIGMALSAYGGGAGYQNTYKPDYNVPTGASQQTAGDWYIGARASYPATESATQPPSNTGFKLAPLAL